MTSASSKAIPFLSLAITLVMVFVEVATGRDLPLETVMPLLLATGVSGVPLSIAKNAIGAKKLMDTNKLREGLNTAEACKTRHHKDTS